jgi:UDP-3-O-[3-hydroxymyristoyl] glucosamine N-acyltransferase
MKLSEIAARVDGVLIGEDCDITGIAPIAEAGPGQLTFIANPKYRAKLKDTKASAVIVANDFPPQRIPLLRVADPYYAFAKALELFHEEPEPPPGTHPTAIIGRRTRIGPHVMIGAHSVIGDDCRIGDKVIIYPNCTIYSHVTIGRETIVHSNCTIRERTIIGERVIIQNGARIGTDGFGYAKSPNGTWYKIIQTGRVIIADDVEIGANSTIDRSAIGQTEIERHTKVDNLVQVGHASKVGENSLLCAQVGLAGSTTLGKNVVFAGQVGVAGHLTIGDNVVATAQTGIPSSVEPNKTISGYPAIDNSDWLRASAVFKKLPDLVKQIRKLQAEIEILRQQQHKE